MANSLSQNIERGTVVILRKGFTGDESERRYVCEDGFGMSDFTLGTSIVGFFVSDGRSVGIDGYDIERIDENQEYTLPKRMKISFRDMKTEIIPAIEKMEMESANNISILCHIFWELNESFVSKIGRSSSESGFEYNVIRGQEEILAAKTPHSVNSENHPIESKRWVESLLGRKSNISK